MDNQIVMSRLAFTKRLYEIALEQTEMPEPINATSILTFHDSVELFLHLASLKEDINCSDFDFIDYWEPLKAKHMPDGLTQKESMKRLNKVRVGLKHSGILPSVAEIELLHASVTNFFEENTPIVFGIQFGEVSMINLVSSEEARRLLRSAEKKVDSGAIEEAFPELALAFYSIVNEHEQSQSNRFGESPYSFGGRFHRLGDFRMLGINLSEIVKAIDQLCDALRIVALGLDYKKYVKFSRLTPALIEIAGGNPRPQERERESPRTLDDYRFCFDFVIESALVLSR
jgi:hypothetical protein